MTISKRELQLSQDLMSLQSQYNALQIENNRLTTLLRKSMESGKLLGDACERLEETVSILKSTAKTTITASAKKIALKK